MYLNTKLGFKPRGFVALHIDTQAQLPFPSPEMGQEQMHHPIPKLRPRRTAIPCFHWLQLHSQWISSSTYRGKTGYSAPRAGGLADSCQASENSALITKRP